jgi:general secretion pathway protein C
MLARLSAFVIWAFVAGALVFWGLRLMVSAPAAPSYAVAVGDVAVAKGDLTALLGAAPVATQVASVAPAAASRFRLFGIVAPKYPNEVSTRGVALIAVDGKMPKAYSIGSHLDGDLTLKSVSLRTVSIGNSGSDGGAITLELPPLPAAATGTLPMGGGENYSAPPPSRSLPAGGPTLMPQPVPQMTPQVQQMPPSMRPEGAAPAS